MSELLRRILFSVVGIPIVLFIIFLGHWYIWGLILLLIEIAWWEYGTMLKNKGFYSKAFLFGYLWIALIFGRSFQYTNSWLNTEGLILILIIVLCISELWLKDMDFSINRMSVQFFGLIYLGLTGYALYLVSSLSDPGWKVFIPLLLSVWLSDSLAYFTGKLIGKHRLNPAVSPGKTVEGAVGAVAGAVLGFSTLLLWTDYRLWIHVLIMGTGVGIIGQTGDMIESMIKRWAGVKDSSGLFPGHGGVMDRIDALLLVAPFIVFYFRYVIVLWKM